MDEPISIIPGQNQAPYEPSNYKNEFLGPITLRYALEKSINVPAVQLMHAMGPETVVSYAPRFGITSEVPPFLSVALGSAEATLEEITSAYSVFPNRGVRMAPYQITRISDREGMVLEENRPEAHDAIRADPAWGGGARGHDGPAVRYLGLICPVPRLAVGHVPLGMLWTSGRLGTQSSIWQLHHACHNPLHEHL